MTHPNEFPGKKFIPYESDGLVETTELPSYPDSAEGLATVTSESISSLADGSVVSEIIAANPMDHIKPGTIVGGPALILPALPEREKDDN